MRNEDKRLAYCDKKKRVSFLRDSLVACVLDYKDAFAIDAHSIASFVAFLIATFCLDLPVHLRLLPPAEK